MDSIDKRLLRYLDQDDEVHGPLLLSQGDRGHAPLSRELSSLGMPRCGSGEGGSGFTFSRVRTTAGLVAIPAADYRLKRYPAAGGSAVAVTASCSGTGTITCEEFTVPDGTWQYTDTPTYGMNWVGIESSKSATVLVDSTAPTVKSTVIGQSSGAVVNGFIRKNTGYYVYANVTDAGSGVKSVTANVANVTSRETAVALTSSGGPFTAPGGGSYSYRSALLTSNACHADGTVPYTVNATDNFDNTSTNSNNGWVTFDTTAPTGSVSYTNGYVITTSVSVSFSATDGSGSGVNSASGQLKRASSALSGGTCTTFGAYSQVGSTGLSSPYADTVVSGNCYKYEYVVSDNVGNQRTATSSSIIKVDTMAPSASITFPVSGSAYDANSGSWTGVITGSASDVVSGVGSVKVSVQQSSGSSSCWTGRGSTFTAACPNYVPVTTGTTNWSLTFAASNLNNGDSYTVVAQATDGAGNTGLSSASTFTYDTRNPTVTAVNPSHMGDCGGQCSAGIYWTITGTNFVSGATVSFARTGASADFSVVCGTTTVVNSTTIVLQVKDTGATTGSATVIVTDPGETAASGTVTATGFAHLTSLSITGPTAVGQGAQTTLTLSVGGAGCTSWGTPAVYFSNPGITGGPVTCSGTGSRYTVSVPITVSGSALTGDGSVTVTVNGNDYAISTDGLTVDVAPLLSINPSSIPAGIVHDAYSSQTFTPSGGTSPYTLAEVGALPAGMSFSGGVLSGTPTQSGSFTFRVFATDSATQQHAGSQAYTLTINAG
ncbi:MAG: putative Ig domain-containing protein [Acidimicrobiales bacterium]